MIGGRAACAVLGHTSTSTHTPKHNPSGSAPTTLFSPTSLSPVLKCVAALSRSDNAWGGLPFRDYSSRLHACGGVLHMACALRRACLRVWGGRVWVGRHRDSFDLLSRFAFASHPVFARVCLPAVHATAAGRALLAVVWEGALLHSMPTLAVPLSPLQAAPACHTQQPHAALSFCLLIRCIAVLHSSVIVLRGGQRGHPTALLVHADKHWGVGGVLVCVQCASGLLLRSSCEGVRRFLRCEQLRVCLFAPLFFSFFRPPRHLACFFLKVVSLSASAVCWCGLL